MEAYTGMAEWYDGLMADTDYDAWAEYLIGLMTRFGVRLGASVLECGCGTGQITLRLSAHGYRVTAFDRSADMLRVAQGKARRSGRQIPFVCQDMRSLSAHHRAGAVVCACDGVNYLTAHADAARFFRSAADALNDGGLLLFDVSSAYKLSRVLGDNTFGDDTEACTYLWLNAYDETTRLLTMDLSFFVPQPDGSYRRFDERHVQRAYEPEELTKLLEQNGFSAVAVYEAFTQRPARTASERIQFVARKRGLDGGGDGI